MVTQKTTTGGRTRSTKPTFSTTSGRASTKTAFPTGRGSSTQKKPTPVGFRPTADERRILDQLAAEGVTPSDALRQGLRLVVQERWLEQARADMLAHRDENLNDEPDAW